MAEEVLVARPLLESMIEGGRQLVERLNADGYPPVGAFWIQEATELRWKLVIAYDDVLSRGLFKSYKRVLDRTQKSPGLFWPSLVRIEDSTHSLVKAVRGTIKGSYSKNHTGPASVNLRSTSYEPTQLYVYRA